MKKLISFLLLAVVALNTFSQSNDPAPVVTKQDYLLKSKHQKTAAWLLMGGGIVLTSIGAITAIPKAADDISFGIMLLPNILTGNLQPAPKTDYTPQTVLLIGGIAAVLSSIQLYIASARNKRKATSLTFKNQSLPSFPRSGLLCQSIPSISLKISL